MLFRSPILPMMWMHMMFMRFPIDIVFLNRENKVIRICHDLRPWRFSPIVLGARIALELRPARRPEALLRLATRSN